MKNEETPVIAICGLIRSENLGELFIARSLEYLIRKMCAEHGYAGELEFTEVDLLGRNDVILPTDDPFKNKTENYCGFDKSHMLCEMFFAGLKKVSNKTQKLGAGALNNGIYRLRHFVWQSGANYKKRMHTFFSEKMEDASFIVVDGAGLLEYCYNEYQEPLLLLSEYAQEHHLEVVYNAIGRAGTFDEKDFRSTILKRALRAECVKYVSARDSLETVQLCAGEKHTVKLLADAAFWLKEAYGAPDAARTKKIGIGIIRGNSLKGYGADFRGEDWVNLFSGIARELEKRGYQYEFFTNGLPGDIKLGEKILANMNLPAEYLVTRPVDDRELYNTIASYSGIITCRMHSSIAAFTLGIPAVILSWNDKVEKLMEIIGYPERAVRLADFNPVYIVNAFEQALSEGVDEAKVSAMKAKAKESVEDYIDLVISALNEKNGAQTEK